MLRILTAFLFGLCLPFSVQAQKSPSQPYNVLFIAVDDLNCDLNSYGNRAVHTPNLDRLASMGTQFNRAYCQFPWCSPSRTSVMTSMRPNTSQVFDLKKHFRSVHRNVVTLPQLFQQNGYYTARVGKIYHYGVPGQIGTDGLDDTLSWHERFNPRGRDKDEEHLLTDFTPQRGIGSSLNWMMAEGRDEEQTDGMVASQAIALLEKDHKEPFFIASGFYRPHCPFVAPKKYFDLYPLESVQLPYEPADDMDDIPQAALWQQEAYWGLNEDQRRQTIRAYQASISFVDAQIGRLMATMDSLDLWKNTVVALWSDHGYNLGHHTQWMKQSLFENAARVPLIIVSPDQKTRGIPSPRTVELLDLYPTLADICNLQIPKHVEGVSLKALVNQPLMEWDKPAFVQVWRRYEGRTFPGRSVRTERWVYNEWNETADGVELYDHLHDPGEWHNLAKDPAYAEVKRDLQRKLQTHWPQGIYTPHSVFRVQTPSTVIPYKTITYTPRDSSSPIPFTLTLTAVYPDNYDPNKRYPAALFFFGGGWKNGSIGQFVPHSHYLASRGMVCFMADYRVESRQGTTPFESVKDAKSAMRYLRAHAGELGIDPDRIVAGGGSAGGHLAAACGTLPGLNEQSDDLSISAVPNALVLFNPVFDNGPTGFAYDRMGARYLEITPLYNIRKGAPPTLVFLGTEDRLVPVETALFYQLKMEAVGSRCELDLFPGEGHGFFNFRNYWNYRETILGMDAFLVEEGFLSGEATIE